jgi:hypothetical protein
MLLEANTFSDSAIMLWMARRWLAIRRSRVHQIEVEARKAIKEYRTAAGGISQRCSISTTWLGSSISS